MNAPLPCHPCPHGSACCTFGASVTADERLAIVAAHGEHALRYNASEDDWRTNVVGGRCVFMVPEGCRIHAEPYYPEVCRGFPFYAGATTEPYPWPVDECPEFEQRADLLALYDPATGKLRTRR